VNFDVKKRKERNKEKVCKRRENGKKENGKKEKKRKQKEKQLWIQRQVHIIVASSFSGGRESENIVREQTPRKKV
jgi:hypothetical protein